MGQTMLILGAFALLSVLVLSVNQTLLSTQTIGLEMEANMTALSIGQSLMDEIATQEFDERTTTGVKIYSASEMTPVNSLRPEVGTSAQPGYTEQTITWIDSAYYDKNGSIRPYDNGGIYYDFASKKYFDDVDDYNGYRRKVYDYKLGYFMDSVHVEYVQENLPDSTSSTQTNQKRITIWVTHPNLSRNQEGQVLPVIIKDLAVYRRFFQ
jgi:hypothetical protein